MKCGVIDFAIVPAGAQQSAGEARDAICGRSQVVERLAARAAGQRIAHSLTPYTVYGRLDKPRGDRYARLMLTPVEHAKIQQTADNMHVPIYRSPDGSLHHLKPSQPLPPGAELFQHQVPWPSSDHGEPAPKPAED